MDYKNNDSDPDDDDGHGTACAGIIGALRNNNELVAGLGGGDNSGSIGVQLFALKVGNSGGGFTRSLAIDAVIEASMNTPSFGYGCHVINYSGGSYEYSEAWRNALHVAADNNVVFVASKGNDNSSNWHYPSDYDGSWVISIGATTASDNRANFSNIGHGIDVCAPGSGNVYTTQRVEDGSVGSFSGTSASAPHVAGSASLILSEALEQGISLHHEDVEGIIEATAEDVNNATLPGYDDELGHGRINAGRALEYMNQPWEITHHSTVGGTIVDTKDWYKAIFYGDGLSNGMYLVKRHEVETTVTLPDFLNTDFYVWGRGTNASTGWSTANPNYQLCFCDVVNINGNEATLRTFLYEVKSITGQSYGWHPTTSDNVTFAYTTLGVGCPVDRYLTQTISPGTEAGTITYSASNSITATNKIESGSDIVYIAGNSITLLPGFEVENEAEFSAYIDGCNSSRSLKSATISNHGTIDSTIFEHDNKKLNSSLIEANDFEYKVYPNPFNDYISIDYYLPKKSEVTIKILDLKGNVVSVLVDNNIKIKGWHNSNFGKTNLSPGVYLYSIDIGNTIKTGKIIKNDK